MRGCRVWPLYDTESSVQFRYEIDRTSFRSMMLYLAWWACRLLGVYIVSQFSHRKALHSVDREYGTFSCHCRTTHIMIWVKGIPLSPGQLDDMYLYSPLPSQLFAQLARHGIPFAVVVHCAGAGELWCGTKPCCTFELESKTVPLKNCYQWSLLNLQTAL